MAASYAETAREAAKWDDVVLTCRTRGHAWEQVNSQKIGRNYDVYFECTRGCGVRKTEFWNHRGLLRKNSTMHYPKLTDGTHAYLSTIGFIDKEGRGALRMATLERKGQK